MSKYLKEKILILRDSKTDKMSKENLLSFKYFIKIHNSKIFKDSLTVESLDTKF